MEGMYAKLAAGNEYDIVFPIAKWVVKLAPRGQAPVDRPRPAAERRPGLLLRLLLQRALVRRRVGGVGPVHRLQDRHRLAHRQGVDDDRQLGGPLERRGPRPHLHPRRPGRGAGDGRAPARLRRQHREGVGARGDEGPPDQPEGVPPGLLLRRHQQHGQRRRLGAPHVERRLPLPPAGPGRRPRRRSTSRRRARARRSTPTPTRSPPTPSTRAPRWCSSTTCSGPRTPSRT